jgi:hypothetical protein
MPIPGWSAVSAAVAVASCLVVASCGPQRPQPVASAAGAPQAGWVIMNGDAENPNHDFVCQSNPRTECVVPVSRADAKTYAAVYFYYHPAAVETRYTGTIQIGFFEGASASHQLRPDFTVKSKDSPASHSIDGIVSSRPGTYEMTIDVTATPIGSVAKQDVQQRVQVIVR